MHAVLLSYYNTGFSGNQAFPLRTGADSSGAFDGALCAADAGQPNVKIAWQGNAMIVSNVSDKLVR
jgi:hypothetical protein